MLPRKELDRMLREDGMWTPEIQEILDTDFRVHLLHMYPDVPKRAEWVGNFLEQVNKRGWGLYVSLPFLLEKRKELWPLYEKYLKKKETIIVVHPSSVFAKEELSRSYGSYEGYLRHLDAFLDRKGRNSLIIYLVEAYSRVEANPIAPLKKFKKWFKKRGATLIVPTDPRDSTPEYDVLLSAEDKFFSFLKELSPKIKIAGEYLWHRDPISAHFNELDEVLRKHGHVEAAQAFRNLLDSTFRPLHSEEVLQLLKKHGITREILESYLPKDTPPKPGCVAWFKKQLEDKGFEVTLLRKQCFPSTNPPGGLREVMEKAKK